MDIEEISDKVREYALEAVKCDKLEEYEKAHDLYLKAANELEILIIKDKNPENIKVYIDRIKNYVLRSKDIKQKKLAKKDEADEETKKLEKQLIKCIIQEKPNIKWEDIAGLENAKELLKETLIFPVIYPQLFKGKCKPWKSILLYGPFGTGKSLLAKAVATEFEGKFFYVSPINITSKWMGESELLIKALFDLARKNKPAVIFFEQIDSLIGGIIDMDNYYNRRFKAEFLIQMQNLLNEGEGILVLGATNIPWAMDPAILNMFQKKIYISLPEKEARKTMFVQNLKGIPNTLTDEQIENLAISTDGFSGMDISNLTQYAILEPVRKCHVAEFFKKIPGNNEMKWNYVPCAQDEPDAVKMTMKEIPDPKAIILPEVNYEDFKEALKRHKATVKKNDLEKQEEFIKEYGQES